MRKAGLVGAIIGIAAIGSCAALAATKAPARTGAASRANTAAGEDRDPYIAMNRVLVANGCSNCHAADYLRVGPAMTDIAMMYAEAKPAELEQVQHNIMAGTKGKWGIAIMPAQQRITSERAAEIVSTIMALNKKAK